MEISKITIIILMETINRIKMIRIMTTRKIVMMTINQMGRLDETNP